MELIAENAAGEPLATLVTHLVVAPEEGDDSPPLGVAVVAEIGAPPALQPDGTVALSPPTVADLTALVDGLVAVPDVPLTLAITPETVDTLVTSTAPERRRAGRRPPPGATGRTVMAMPYRPRTRTTSRPPTSWGARPTARARSSGAHRRVGVEPVSAPWLSPPNLGATGLGVLAFSGIHRIVVSDAEVEPLEPGIISYSLAQPFLLTVPEARPPISRPRTTSKPSPPIRGCSSASPRRDLRASWPAVCSASWHSSGSSNPASPGASCSRSARAPQPRSCG